MDIKDRLLKIMSNENLTSSAFADYIGVQRSSISHIISGRNKPSLDFLQKILSSYPKYSAEWLIMGRGDHYKEPKPQTFFTNGKLGLDAKTTEKDAMHKEGPAVYTKENNLFNSPVNQKPLNPLLNNELAPKSEPKQEELLTKPLKSENKGQIERIIIFYEDKTFTEYSPK